MGLSSQGWKVRAPRCSVLEVARGAEAQGSTLDSHPPAVGSEFPTSSPQCQDPRLALEGQESRKAGRVVMVASETFVYAQGAACDVLQLPRHVVRHADAVVRQHLQHQPQIQPPLLPWHAVPG